MVLINNNHIISVSLAEFYNSCIKDIDLKDITMRDNKISMVCAWLPNIISIDVSTNEMIISFKDEKKEINFGFTGYEWKIDDYINDFYEKRI